MKTHNLPGKRTGEPGRKSTQGDIYTMYAVFYRFAFQSNRQVLANNQRALFTNFRTREDAEYALRELAKEEFRMGFVGQNYEIFEVQK